jgi:hypothetical protein
VRVILVHDSDLPELNAALLAYFMWTSACSTAVACRCPDGHILRLRDVVDDRGMPSADADIPDLAAVAIAGQDELVACAVGGRRRAWSRFGLPATLAFMLRTTRCSARHELDTADPATHRRCPSHGDVVLLVGAERNAFPGLNQSAPNGGALTMNVLGSIS